MPLPFEKIVSIPIGPLHIQVWGLMVAMGMLVGLWIALKEAKRLHVSKDLILDVFLWTVISSMIGSRLFYAAFAWEEFTDDPLRVFRIWEGGMAFYGGFLSAVLTIFIFLRVKKVSFWKVADVLAPGLAIGIFIGRIGCYLTGMHIGSVMTQAWFWGSVFPGDPRLRHEPSLYLSLDGLFIFFLLWSLRHRLKKPGQMTMLFLLSYGISRFFLDFFRAADLPGMLSDPRTIFHLTAAQLLSIAMAIIGSIGVFKPEFFTRTKKA